MSRLLTADTRFQESVCGGARGGQRLKETFAAETFLCHREQTSFSKAGSLGLQSAQSRPEDLLKHRSLGPPRGLIQEVWSGSQEFVFLSSSQVTLLPAQGPCFENRGSSPGHVPRGEFGPALFTRWCSAAFWPQPVLSSVRAQSSAVAGPRRLLPRPNSSLRCQRAQTLAFVRRGLAGVRRFDVPWGNLSLF